MTWLRANAGVLMLAFTVAASALGAYVSLVSHVERIEEHLRAHDRFLDDLKAARWR